MVNIDFSLLFPEFALVYNRNMLRNSSTKRVIPYFPSQELVSTWKKKEYPKIFVICGPSGSGKEVVLNGALKRIKKLRRVKTLMTRPILRREDKAGREKVSVRGFFNLDRQGRLIEKNFYAGHWYGTPTDGVEEVIEEGNNAILDIDINGMKALKKRYSNVVSIFLKTNFEDLKKRIESRGGFSPSEIGRRLSIAKAEIAKSKICDYNVWNRQDHLNQAIDRVVKIIKGKK